MQTVTIIMYHYVRPIKDSRYPGIKGLELDLFKEQLDFVRKNYKVVTVEEVVEAVNGKAVLPDRAMLLTFDDGYRDHYEYVLPLLRRYGMQGSFYVPSAVVEHHRVLDTNKIHYILAGADIDSLMSKLYGMLDDYRQDGYRENDYVLEPNEELYAKLARVNRWDPAEVIFIKRLLQTYLPEKLRHEIVDRLFLDIMNLSEEEFAKELYINMDEIREMKKEGMFFGLHGSDHIWLDKASEEQMMKDISHAKEYFADAMDPEYLVMNYPYGGYNDAVVNYVRSIGCKLGITVEARMARIGEDDPMLLPRLDTNDLPPKSENYREYIG